MPPPPSQKGTGKKSGRSSDARHSRSRNTTPAISTNDFDGVYLDIVIKPLRGASYDEIIEPQGSSVIPDSKALEKVMTRIQNLIEQIDVRDEEASKALRRINEKKKEKLAEDQDNENVRRQQSQRDAEDQERVRRANKEKKTNAGKSERHSERPLTHGAHGLAPQDGSNLGK